ncbi:hypothetical protein C8D76_101253 [Pasteurella langaaensis DSM 22999]|uniref:Uncharacterized protein n=1 Tax=Alitibacter langaaensis DSM 22999 TaxID=1122935 RepID=A0A2U0THB1_9PAST|nr:hypothetical protein C8D76_101253 [Pasteurella langaaensis DSM 22999]
MNDKNERYQEWKFRLIFKNMILITDLLTR